MLNIAIYGKGGIGKSTTSANLSYGLSRLGKKVIQIGCDPKHDSTRLLLNGESQKTVLDAIMDRTPINCIDDVAVLSDCGVRCIESGGPEPGVGCAGRGILTVFDLLNKIGIDDLGADVKIFDVLGDVVCGGFAVPLRPEYADIVYIVTSGEFMSIYAANNILKGITHFDPDTPRIAGLIFNRKGLENENAIVRRFSDATGIPIIADIPRSPEFTASERHCKTVLESYPESIPAKSIGKIIDDIMSHIEGAGDCSISRPLNDDQLNALARGEDIPIRRDRKSRECCTTKKDTDRTCASRGAVLEAAKIRDLTILVHGPDSCAYSMSHTRDNHCLREMGYNPRLESNLKNLITSTNITSDGAIFGSNRALEDSLRRIVDEGASNILVVTTCVPGIIGDDSKVTVDRVSKELDAHVMMLDLEGNFHGNSGYGKDSALDLILNQIDDTVDPVPGTVNIVDRTFARYNYGKNEERATELLDLFSLKMKSKIIYNCSIGDIVHAKEAAMNIFVNDSKENERIKSILSEKGMDIFPLPLPKGIRETERWVRNAGIEFGEQEVAERFIKRIREEYDTSIERSESKLSGKRVMILTGTYYPIDWMIDVMMDLKMNIEKIGVIRYGNEVNTFRTDYSSSMDISEDYNISDLKNDLDMIKPDLVLGHSRYVSDVGYRNGLLPSEDMSYMASVDFIKYLERLINIPPIEGWKVESA